MLALCAELAPPSPAAAAADVAVPRALLPAAAPLLAVGADGAADKEGVLFVQTGMLKQWRRAWCVIATALLTVHRIGSKGSEILAEMALVLCNVKPVRSKAPDEEGGAILPRVAIAARVRAAAGVDRGDDGGVGRRPPRRRRRGYGAGTTTVGAAAGVPMIKQASALLATGARCADCGAAAPEWASANLCVLLCLECAGCHRAMGTHLSKVRSLKLDSWEPPLLALLSRLQPAADGTGGANAVWEAALNGASPPTVRRPTPSDGAGGAGHREHREVFVRLKYELREFVDKSGDAAALGAALLAACEGEQPEEALRLIAFGRQRRLRGAGGSATAAAAAAGAACSTRRARRDRRRHLGRVARPEWRGARGARRGSRRRRPAGARRR